MALKQETIDSWKALVQVSNNLEEPVLLLIKLNDFLSDLANERDDVSSNLEELQKKTALNPNQLANISKFLTIRLPLILSKNCEETFQDFINKQKPIAITTLPQKFIDFTQNMADPNFKTAWKFAKESFAHSMLNPTKRHEQTTDNDRKISFMFLIHYTLYYLKENQKRTQLEKKQKSDSLQFEQARKTAASLDKKTIGNIEIIQSSLNKQLAVITFSPMVFCDNANQYSTTVCQLLTQANPLSYNDVIKSAETKTDQYKRYKFKTKIYTHEEISTVFKTELKNRIKIDPIILSDATIDELIRAISFAKIHHQNQKELLQKIADILEKTKIEVSVNTLWTHELEQSYQQVFKTIHEIVTNLYKDLFIGDIPKDKIQIVINAWKQWLNSIDNILEKPEQFVLDKFNLDRKISECFGVLQSYQKNALFYYLLDNYSPAPKTIESAHTFYQNFKFAIQNNTLLLSEQSSSFIDLMNLNYFNNFLSAKKYSKIPLETLEKTLISYEKYDTEDAEFLGVDRKKIAEKNIDINSYLDQFTLYLCSFKQNNLNPFSDELDKLYYEKILARSLAVSYLSFLNETKDEKLAHNKLNDILKEKEEFAKKITTFIKEFIDELLSQNPFLPDNSKFSEETPFIKYYINRVIFQLITDEPADNVDSMLRDSYDLTTKNKDYIDSATALKYIFDMKRRNLQEKIKSLYEKPKEKEVEPLPKKLIDFIERKLSQEKTSNLIDELVKNIHAQLDELDAKNQQSIKKPGITNVNETVTTTVTNTSNTASKFSVYKDKFIKTINGAIESSKINQAYIKIFNRIKEFEDIQFEHDDILNFVKTVAEKLIYLENNNNNFISKTEKSEEKKYFFKRTQSTLANIVTERKPMPAEKNKSDNFDNSINQAITAAEIILFRSVQNSPPTKEF